MRNPLAFARQEWKCIRKGAPITGAILCGVVWLVVLLIVGSPRRLLWWISARIPVIPSWLLLLLLLLHFVVCGFSIGMALGCNCRGKDVFRYRGAFFFAVGLPLFYLWYAFLFGAHVFLLAVLSCLVATACFIISAINFCRVCRTAAMGLWGTVLMGCYLTVFSILCFFSL